MSAPTITQAMLDFADCDLVAAMALGKTVSQFAQAMVVILVLKIAEAATHDIAALFPFSQCRGHVAFLERS